MNIKPWPKLWKHSYLKLIVKRLQRLCHVSPDLFIFVNFAVQIEDCIRKTPSTHYTSGVENFMQIQPSFVISWMVTCTLMPWLQSSLKFTYLKVRLLERYTLKCLFWCVEGEVAEFIQAEGREQLRTTLRFALWG